jgi:hypothetical protein
LNAIALALALFSPQDAAAEELCRSIEAAIRKQDPAALDGAIDLEALLGRALRGVKGEPGSMDGFRAGVRKSFAFGRVVLREMGKEGSYRFVRVRTVGGERRALFRMLVGENFSYQEFLLDARSRIVDVYTHLSAEWMSEGFRRSYLALLAKEPGALEKALGAENEYVTQLPKVLEFTKLVREGKHAEALKAWEGLAPSARAEKSVLVLRTTAAAQLGGAEALRALEELRKALPGDPCIPALSIAPLTEAGKHDDALKAVDDLDRALGGDPFLHVLRSWIQSGAGRLEPARASARKAVEAEKDLAIAYWTLVNLSLAERKFAETAKVLTELEANTGIRVEALRGEQFAEFLKSPDYERWRRRK